MHKLFEMTDIAFKHIARALRSHLRFSTACARGLKSYRPVPSADQACTGRALERYKLSNFGAVWCFTKAPLSEVARNDSSRVSHACTSCKLGMNCMKRSGVHLTWIISCTHTCLWFKFQREELPPTSPASDARHGLKQARKPRQSRLH
jgi:hypothetical protein